RVGVDLRDAPDHAAAVDDGVARGYAVVGALADHHPLPPAGEVALRDARVLEPEALGGGYGKEGLQALDLRLQLAVLLDRERVAGVEPREVAAGLDQLVLRVDPERPDALDVARVRGRFGDGGRHLEEAGPGKRPQGDGGYEPGRKRHAQHDEGSRLVESLGSPDPHTFCMSQDRSFSTAPVPFATAERGSSATVTGSPVLSLSRRSRPRMSEPPPAITKPRSTRSAESSGGQRSRVVRTASTMAATVSARASRTSWDVMWIVFGRPATESRPLTSIDSSSSRG